LLDEALERAIGDMHTTTDFDVLKLARVDEASDCPFL
jgi:hypothetical protein